MKQMAGGTCCHSLGVNRAGSTGNEQLAACPHSMNLLMNCSELLRIAQLRVVSLPFGVAWGCQKKRTIMRASFHLHSQLFKVPLVRAACEWKAMCEMAWEMLHLPNSVYDPA